MSEAPSLKTEGLTVEFWGLKILHLLSGDGALQVGGLSRDGVKTRSRKNNKNQ